MTEVELLDGRLACPLPLAFFSAASKSAWVSSEYAVARIALGPIEKLITELLTLQPINGNFGAPQDAYKVFDIRPSLMPQPPEDALEPSVGKSEEEFLFLPRAFGIAQFGPARFDFRVNGMPIAGAVTGTLYDWQDKVVEHLVSKMRAPPIYGGVLQADCGTGKTIMAIVAAIRLGVKAAVIVNKEFLLTQWTERISGFVDGCEIGRVQGDRCVIGDFTIVMLQTVAGGRYPRETFDSIGFVIVDEVHHLPARTYSMVARYFRARHTLGLSATLRRADGLEQCLFWQLGPLLARVRRAKQGVERVCVGVDIRRGVRPIEPHRRGRLDRVQLVSIIVKMEERNGVIATAVRDAVQNAHRVLVISERLKHLRDLQILLPEAIIYVGERSAKARTTRDELMQHDQKIVLTTKQMASEAFDWPACTAVALATPVPVGPALEQIVGRCQRGGGGDDSGVTRLIIDIADVSPALHSMSLARQRWYAARGYAT